MQKLIIEAAINEQAPKSDNPNVPYTVDEVVAEAIACADAGAAIVHFHARDADTGDMQEPGTAFYLDAMRQIPAAPGRGCWSTRPMACCRRPRRGSATSRRSPMIPRSGSTWRRSTRARSTWARWRREGTWA